MASGTAAVKSVPPVTGSSDEENADPASGEGNLLKLWQQGTDAIASHRTDNLFQSLEERTLTTEEQGIIEQRVALQRKMFQEYEKRERKRKVAELLEVCPDISLEEAEQALEMCDNREDDAAAQLVSNPTFVQQVKVACGLIAAPPVIAAAPAQRKEPSSSRHSNRRNKAAGPRPKLINPATLGDNVFVGAFRGKGFKPPPKGRARPIKSSGSEQQPVDEQIEDDEERVTEGEGEEQLDEGEEEEGVSAQQPLGRQQLGMGSEVEQHAVQGMGLENAAADRQQQQGVLLWPAAMGAAANRVQGQQRYVLVQKDTLQAPTESALHAARRQFGEPSDSGIGAGPVNEAEDPGAASAARSRPAKAASTEPAQKGEQQQEEQEQPQQHAECAEGQPAAQAAQRGSRAQRNVGANRSTKRAVSAALSDDEETEIDEPANQHSEEEEDSDNDFVVPPPSSRHNTKAYAVQAKLRTRPSRASKQAAAAAMVVYAASSGDEGGDAEMDSDSEDAPSARLRQRQTATRGSGRQTKVATIEAAEEHAAVSGRGARANKRQRVEQNAAIEASLQQGDRNGLGERQPSASSPAAEGAEGSGGRRAAVPRVRAISSTGHTCRGRVKQKSHKSAELVEAGTLRAEKGWYNAGYIFPEGFQSRTLFRSSVAIDQLCVHECHVVGKGGQYWPQPTFKVVALDRPDEPLIAKSCTGCWTGILKRINAEIEARRKAGEGLPPPPKTAIAGPEYFGFNQPNIHEAVEALDRDRTCAEYWAGKQDRQRAAAGLAASGRAQAPHASRPPSNAGSRRAGGMKARTARDDSSDSDEPVEPGDDDETQFMTNKWSAVSRSDRYRKRLQDNGEDTSALDKDNPLPHFIDPITMSAVVRPAISPFGHVAGLATWKVVLAEKQQCPFTNQPLQFEQLKLLSKTNIHLHRGKIVNGSTGAQGQTG